MHSDMEYVVDFDSEVAWSLVYEDAKGRLFFVFEPGDHPKAISLHRTPLNSHRKEFFFQTRATRKRVAEAFERTRAYLVGCGYEVFAYEN
jgi:hypothetical protein